MIENPLPEEVVHAFHLMWDHYPEPSSIVHKSLEVIAVNKAHCFTPGTICAKTGKSGAHVGCKANQAISQQKTVTIAHPLKMKNNGAVTHWIPIEGYPDYCIHVSTRFCIDYENESFAWAPVTDEEKHEMSYYQPTGEYLFPRVTCETDCGCDCSHC